MTTAEDGGLPAGWVSLPLDRLLSRSRQSIDPARFHDQQFELYSVPSYDSAQPEVKQGSDIGSTKQAVKPSNVLLCKINPRINRVWIVGNKTPYPKIASTEWIVFETSDVVIPAYLRHFLTTNAIRDHLAMNVSGVGGSLMRVRPAVVKGYPFPLPPLAEQRRIVAKLEELLSDLEAGVEALRRVQAALKRYRAAVLQAACTGQLVPQDPSDEPAEQLLKRILAERRARWEDELRARGKDLAKATYEAPAAPDTDGLPELPAGWCWVTLNSLLSEPLANGKSVPSAGNGFPVLRLTALRDGGIDLTQTKLGALDTDRAAPFLVHKGDFLVSRGNGSIRLVGRGGLVEIEPDRVAFPDLLIRVRVSAGLCYPKFLPAIWDSPLIRHQIETVARTTAGIFKINQQDMERFVIPLPPLAMQYRIVSEVEQRNSVVSQLLKTIEVNLARSDRLRQSILHQAFAGQLVPQDPSDEAAGALLARLAQD